MDSIIPPNDIPLKQCKGPCGQFLPDTSEFFPGSKQKYKGVDKVYLSKTCRQCAKEAHHTKYLLAKANPPEVPPGALIVCSVCKNPLPAIDEFFDRYPCNTGRYGFASECKPCKAEKAEARRKTPKGKAREKEQRKRRYDANPEHFRRQRMRRYYANKETENERNRIYCHAHCQERSRQRREYRNTHPGSRRSEAHKQRARKRAVAGTHTEAQVQEQLKRQRYRCYYAACGFSKFPRVKENGQWKYLFDVEHTFPLARVAGTDIPANDMSYLVLACHDCNQSKGDKFPHEWFEGGRLL